MCGVYVCVFVYDVHAWCVYVCTSWCVSGVLEVCVRLCDCVHACASLMRVSVDICACTHMRVCHVSACVCMCVRPCVCARQCVCVDVGLYIFSETSRQRRSHSM